MGAIIKAAGLEKIYYVGTLKVLVFSSHSAAIEYFQEMIGHGQKHISIIDNEVYLG